MRHDHFVPQFRQQPTHPRRVRPRFQRDTAARRSAKLFAQSLGGRAHTLLQSYPARFHPTRNTHSNDRPGPDQSSASVRNNSCSAASLRCYPSSLPVSFISCASSTSITWERTASRPETGLLIPSDYSNCRIARECRNPRLLPGVESALPLFSHRELISGPRLGGLLWSAAHSHITGSTAQLVPGAWERCIARLTRSWGATWRLRSCQPMWPAIPIA